MAILALPGLPAVYFYTGPLAWNGLLSFHLPLLAFIAWIVLMMLALFTAINRQCVEPA
jgi:hypothetical protein